MLVVASSGGAAVSRDGWGLGIADDDAIGSFAEPPASLTTDRLLRLRPKTFRFQIFWDAVGNPNLDPMEHQYIRRAIRQIVHLRGVGVEQVVATFKKRGPTPSPTLYETEIRQVVDDLAPYVDVWGPANEPNDGEKWLPYDGGQGPTTLAAFYDSLSEVVAVADPTAQRTSPDFLDACVPNGQGGCTPESLTELRTYVHKYESEGGDWGDYVAFHAYRGVHRKTRMTIDNLVDLIPPGKPIWITEVGGYGRSATVNDPPEIQAQKVDWMLNGEPGNPGLASHPRVSKIFYYHMQSGGPTAAHDSALLNQDLSPRPSWHLWCAATHGNDPTHPDCTDQPPQPAPARLGVYTSSGNHFAYSRTRSGSIKQAQWDLGTGLWHATLLGGAAASESSAYPLGSNHYVYWRGTNGSIWQWLWDSGTTQWHLSELGGSAAGQPVAYSSGGNHFVYFRGTNGAIWQHLWDSATGQWHLTQLGGSAASEPTAYTSGGTHYVYFKGADGAVWQLYSSNGSWHLYRLGGAAAGTPIGYPSGGNHFLYFRGSNGAIWQYLWDQGTGQWHLTQLGGAAASEPAAYMSGTSHNVYFRGTDGAIWQYLWYPGGGQWHLTRLGGSATGSPAAYASGTSHYVYFRGTNGGIWQYLWYPGGGQWHLTQIAQE